MPTKLTLLPAMLLLSFVMNAQYIAVPDSLPDTKEAITRTEPKLIELAKWLETTAIGEQMDTRIRVNAWVLAWITNSHSVSITVRSSLMKPFDKNPQLLLVFMAGYSRYVLENNYSKDELKANTAGMKAAINCASLGGDVKKDKNLNKIIEKDKEGKLEEWVQAAMK